MSLFTFFSGSGSNAFKNQVKAINNNAALSDTEKMEAISLLIYPYIPLINYDWSTTTTSGLRYLKDGGRTPTYNASMYFGRGTSLNGVDQYISITPINLSGDFTIKIDLQNAKTLTNRSVVGSILNTDYIKFNGSDVIIKIGGVYRSLPMQSVPIVGTNYCFIVERLNGTVSMWLNDDKLITSFTENSNLILDSIGGTGGGAPFNGVFKDLFIFNRTLTQAEITQSYEQPEAFYAMAQADSACVLNMPMCETSSTVRNYKTGIDYAVANYTSSVRDNAKNLQYGLQTCKFVRDSLGVIQSASDYLVCDGVGYAIIPSHTDTVNIKMTVSPTSLSGNLLSGGVTKTLTGLTLNIDNDVVMSNVTPTGAITLASGFSGTIKTYKEELV